MVFIALESKRYWMFSLFDCCRTRSFERCLHVPHFRSNSSRNVDIEPFTCGVILQEFWQESFCQKWPWLAIGSNYFSGENQKWWRDGWEEKRVANSWWWQVKRDSKWKQTVIITSRWPRRENSDFHCSVPCQGVRWSGVAKGWLHSKRDLLRKVNLSFFVTQMGHNDCTGFQEVELPACIITKMCHSISLTNW